MEFSGPAPLGPYVTLAAELPWRKSTDVRHVEPGDRADNSAGEAGRRPDQNATAAAARDITALRREMARRDKPAGPPPSFEVSLLEVEQDIKQVIARIEAARNHAREADALRPDAGAQAPAALTDDAPDRVAVSGTPAPAAATHAVATTPATSAGAPVA